MQQLKTHPCEEENCKEPATLWGSDTGSYYYCALHAYKSQLPVETRDEIINLRKGAEIVYAIQSMRNIQRALKDAFAHRELDGGPKAAVNHPLYLQSERRIAQLEEELVGLI